VIIGFLLVLKLLNGSTLGIRSRFAELVHLSGLLDRLLQMLLVYLALHVSDACPFVVHEAPALNEAREDGVGLGVWGRHHKIQALKLRGLRPLYERGHNSVESDRVFYLQGRDVDLGQLLIELNNNGISLTLLT
jgi:hypothetical protein